MPTISVARPTTSPPSDHARAQFGAQWLWPAIAVISVNGELDASNAAELTECGIRHTRPSGQLILDMSEVEFFGACCFACLHTVNVRCAGENIDWVLIPSPAVWRVLRICDPERALPASTGLPAALVKLRNQPRQLQLVNPER
ncbi:MULTISPECIES: STAS domain-containing protein [unclassified Mycolicibacterium]|uniref:STAS domain-containing protein n=1 Tax=unclassified Mycolicibacterium TaxID=2636767 RepID=UPI0012DEF9C5|nr:MULTISPECIES: STAS domain-containing protein [unclassified Mycolicibacterium]MUL81085.1 STAS domain-containing protein [Mycolicibacterium sp. CBMA 329]MUL86851.1 STAS domain-containing protein [Mycolicibacterium sp. CBMA 331]MUL98864.1 STAS domain-containing protein [Mycolicibacterium sp. CBMA 334]MUM28876.1 STAS domain-containing protein [Mycolicibacterium sp. CBMA 295]MUM37148.1 STAS domain-containing protein [Mycolicibacterium sp. CBMA 247]